MAEYIERKALLKGIDEYHHTAHIQSITRETEEAKILWRGIHSGVNYCRNHILEAPTTDVVEVRHGEWVDGHCTECGEEAMYSTFDEAIYDYDWEENLQYSHTETNVEYHLTDYCPHCGAKM